mmetsp:Transcript_12493/g.46685  ORF Transcript_12493/g.46685 Transcript_12493/m.46685 type:complete len:229 (+) Transcript_12493:2525-3211(+)
MERKSVVTETRLRPGVLGFGDAASDAASAAPSLAQRAERAARVSCVLCSSTASTTSFTASTFALCSFTLSSSSFNCPSFVVTSPCASFATVPAVDADKVFSVSRMRSGAPSSPAFLFGAKKAVSFARRGERGTSLKFFDLAATCGVVCGIGSAGVLVVLLVARNPSSTATFAKSIVVAVAAIFVVAASASARFRFDSASMSLFLSSSNANARSARYTCNGGNWFVISC